MSLSKGAKKLKSLLREVYGSHIKIVEELQLGERLRLDFYLPNYGLGFEYHGRQHREFVEHFHKTAGGFREAQIRDQRKFELCVQQDIALVVIWFDDEMTADLIRSRANTALEEFVPMESTKKEAWREPEDRKKARLAKAKAARQERYRWQKELKSKRLKAAKERR